MMFAQANSEHCRHKIFNASFAIDGVPQDKSMFGMIRNTHQAHPEHTIVRYATTRRSWKAMRWSASCRPRAACTARATRPTTC
jgi:phosphoribosylformylglycinamidine synthase